MTVIPFQVPRLDVADRILGRLDLSSVREEHFIAMVQGAGFPLATMRGRLNAREQVAFLVNSIGESETLQRLLELSGEAAVADNESPASIEFQVGLTDAIQEQSNRLGAPGDDILPAAVFEAGFGPICTLCGSLDVRIHPWVTMAGELLLQWRHRGQDYVATVYEPTSPDGELMLALETAERREDRTFSVAALSAFVRYGTL